MRYTYNISVADAIFECANVQEVVKVVNEHAGFSVLTEAMVFSLLTRPHRANKRLFAAGKIHIGRTTKLTGNVPSANLDLQPSDIPNLSADKITSGTFAKSKISTAETWALADIPFLPATKIASD